MSLQECIQTAQHIATHGKGILAADESEGTIKKRFDAIKAECTEENRRFYRGLLFTAPTIQDYISGVILYEETLKQKTQDGIPFSQYLASKGIMPGIKVDKGLIDLPGTNKEKVTQGLDNLNERLIEYKKLGAKFAKWRAVYNISDCLPSFQAIYSNSECLARYAALCQQNGIAPIVEPEVLIDGNHTIERCAEVTEQVLSHVFHTLRLHHVCLEGMILKPSMVIAGKECAKQAKPEQVAELTVRILKRTVPAAVPTINFLSGGQTPEQSTLHLDLMNKLGHLPWNLSFSYGRALQDPSLKAWHGDNKQAKAAQDAFIKRAQLNGLAAKGNYSESLEKMPVTN